MPYVRLNPEERRRVIVKAIVQAARDVGVWKFTHFDVSSRCDVETSVSTVHHHFSTKASLRETAAANDEAIHDEYYK